MLGGMAIRRMSSVNSLSLKFWKNCLFFRWNICNFFLKTFCCCCCCCCCVCCFNTSQMTLIIVYFLRTHLKSSGLELYYFTIAIWVNHHFNVKVSFHLLPKRERGSEFETEGCDWERKKERKKDRQRERKRESIGEK